MISMSIRMTGLLVLSMISADCAMLLFSMCCHAFKTSASCSCFSLVLM